MAEPRPGPRPKPGWAVRVLPPYHPPPAPANDRRPPGRGGNWRFLAWLVLLLAVLFLLKIFFTSGS